MEGRLKVSALITTVGALIYRALAGISPDQLHKSTSVCLALRSAPGLCRGCGRCLCHAAISCRLHPDPTASLLPSDWVSSDWVSVPLGVGTEGDAAEPGGPSWDGAGRVRQPGRSLSYCSLCCTHPAEKSQMSAGEAGMTDGSFRRAICSRHRPRQT